VLIAGDSTGVELAVGMREYASEHPHEIRVSHSAFAGCGLSAGDDGRLHAWHDPVEWIDITGCTIQWNSIPLRVVAESIDVVVVCIGPWDAGVIGFPDGRLVSVLDPEGRRLVTDAYIELVAAVRALGAVPVFVRPATIDVEWERRHDTLDDPARWDVMRSIVDSLGVDQIDLPGFLAARSLDGREGRPDGIHLGPEVRSSSSRRLSSPRCSGSLVGDIGPVRPSVRWGGAKTRAVAQRV
jgi:hypothetical protein